MNCVELQNSLAEVEDASTIEQRAHLIDCPACYALVQELDLIIEAAGRLQGAEEPSPRVWNSISTALQEEGLIRTQRAVPVPISSFSARWGAARWLVPAAAMLLVALGLFVKQQSDTRQALQQSALVAPVVKASDLNDDDLIQEVADNTPAMKGEYEENLRRVNESIREAQTFVDESPNDEDARRSLMDAYHQKSMLFELAMERSLP
jgi:hypothetical protein